MNHADPTSLTMPSATQIVITRSFDAPRWLVFEAWTTPEHVRRWYGPSDLAMPVCEIDLRVGGRWRYVLRAPDGSEHGYWGEYLEIVRPERLVYSEGYEGLPLGHDHTVTTTFTERDGKTTLTSTLDYRSQGDRDGHVASGMEPGMRETLDRLEAVLSAL
ncbi:SRPBCC family protein [Deinococcus antarcticus]|uniref:SRPBCC family protein n=1 Tax=Deinococcus antarcticus TaxID=1298767 RepID=A0ABV8A809_9DEIO